MNRKKKRRDKWSVKRERNGRKKRDENQSVGAWGGRHGGMKRTNLELFRVMSAG